jgi:hypothetical protein
MKSRSSERYNSTKSFMRYSTNNTGLCADKPHKQTFEYYVDAYVVSHMLYKNGFN